ncbi:MAG: hypothetical protein AAGN46_04625 [Acidobacteriota bacterium]
MCETEGQCEGVRRLDVPHGKVTQCTSCYQIGVEFGTSYLVFSHSDFIRFGSWLQNLVEEEKLPKGEKLLLQVEGSESHMLSLGANELKIAADVFASGARWVVPAPSTPQPPAEPDQVSWVH